MGMTINFAQKWSVFFLFLFLALLSAYIMNAEIPLFSLKIKKFNLKDNALQIIFLLSSILMLLFLGYAGIPLIIIFYVMLSVVNNKFLKNSQL